MNAHIDNPTTKRFPRRSQFGHWQGVIERHKRPLAERVADAIFAAVLGGGAGVLLFLVDGPVRPWLRSELTRNA